MRLGLVVVGAIFLLAAVLLYLRIPAIESLVPSEPYPSAIDYAPLLAISVGIAGFGMLVRGLFLPSAASMRQRMQPMAASAPMGPGYGSPSGSPPPMQGGAPQGVTYCSSCGRPNASDASFCQGCGKPLTSR